MALSGALGVLLELKVLNEPSKCLIQISLGEKTDKAEADKPVSNLKYKSVLPGDKGMVKMNS